MTILFENYDEFCDEVYKLFKIDVKGGEGEYRIIGYMIFVAVQKAYATETEKLESISAVIDQKVTQFDEISTGTRLGMMTSVKMLSEILDKKHLELTELDKFVYKSLHERIETEMSSIAARILKDALSKNGLSLNDQLNSTIKELSSVSENAVRNTNTMANGVKKVLSSTTLRLLGFPFLGAFASIILVLLLQSIGLISLPIQANIDAAAFAHQIMLNSR